MGAPGAPLWSIRLRQQQNEMKQESALCEQKIKKEAARGSKMASQIAQGWGKRRRWMQKNSFSPKHLFYDKLFFIEIAKKNKIHIQIIDEDKLDLPFYSNSQYRYSVIYTI